MFSLLKWIHSHIIPDKGVLICDVTDLFWEIDSSRVASVLSICITTGSPQLLELQVNTPSQSLVVTAARLIYKRFEYNTWVEIYKEAFVPAGVIDARYVG